MTLSISVRSFKKRYLDFHKIYINKTLSTYLGKNNSLVESLKTYFPYISDNDLLYFKKYIRNSKIVYSNRIQLSLEKRVLMEYTDTLANDRIAVDIIRLNFTKNFIYNFGGKINKYSTISSIDTKGHDHFREDNIFFYNYEQISNKKKFLANILEENIYYKYLLHQDIHNSIINPILNSIMLSNYYKIRPNSNSVIIQLKEITQIYKFTNKSCSKIEMVYFIQEYFIYDKKISDTPIEIKIDPYLLIKIEMDIGDNNITINLTY